MDVSEAIDEQALIKVNDTLLTQIKELDTVEDVTKFWEDYDNGTFVEDRVNLTSTFRRTCDKKTRDICLEGYIVKRSNNITSFSPYLPKDMCEQFIYTQLTLELKQASRRDYTEVYLSIISCRTG